MRWEKGLSKVKIAFRNTEVLLCKVLQTWFTGVDGFQIWFSRNKYYFISHIYFTPHLELNWILMIRMRSQYKTVFRALMFCHVIIFLWVITITDIREAHVCISFFSKLVYDFLPLSKLFFPSYIFFSFWSLTANLHKTFFLRFVHSCAVYVWSICYGLGTG